MGNKSLVQEIMAPVIADATANDWDVIEYSERAKKLDDDILLRSLVVMRSQRVAPSFIHQPMERLYNSLPWNGMDTYEGNVSMASWRAILEAVAADRGLVPTILNITADLGDDVDEEISTPRPKKRRTREGILDGRPSSAVSDPNELRKIWAAYKGNGGKFSYEKLEGEFKLRSANGMTAYRLVQKAAKLMEKENASK